MVCRDCSQDDAGTTAHFIPDLDERLRSPNAFSTSDNAQITELIDRAGTELTACQTEIASLRSRIALLTRKHDMMKLHIEKARSLLAPVRKLPNEILVEIFMLLADARLSFDPPEFVKVCKRWYSLALSTPRLWSDSPIYIIRRDDQTLIQVKQWLRLSRMIPLHITLCGDIVSQMPSTNDHEQILQEVLAHSARWKSLRITQIGSLVSYLGANQLNALEHVQFSNADTSPAVFSSFWSSCPNVYDLIVVAISSEVVNTFPWNQIKRLAVNQHSLRILSQIQTLDGLECLRFFYNKALPRSQQTWETWGPRTLDRVRTLQILFSGGHRRDESPYESIREALSYLTLPSLETVILRLTEFRLPEGSESEIPFFAGGFLSLLQRSNCSQLTTLVVKSPTLGLQYTVISILKHTPSLINLTIYDAVPRSGDLDYLPIITPGFLRGLLVPDSLSLFGSSSIIIPKLRNLWLKARGDTFDEGAFVDMVLSRWLPNGLEHSVYADLEELKFVDLLVVGRRLDKDVWNRLDGVGATGLRVRLLDGLE